MIIYDKQRAREMFEQSLSTLTDGGAVSVDMQDFDQVTRYAHSYQGIVYNSPNGVNEQLLEQIYSDLHSYGPLRINTILLNIRVSNSEMLPLDTLYQIIEAFHSHDYDLSCNIIWGITASEDLKENEIEIVGALSISF